MVGVNRSWWELNGDIDMPHKYSRKYKYNRKYKYKYQKCVIQLNLQGGKNLLTYVGWYVLGGGGSQMESNTQRA